MSIKTETGVGIFILTATVIFMYMSFQIGSLRFNKRSFNLYYAYFTDISGISKKADLKIAGVKVGWVESATLAEDNRRVKAVLMISREYRLHADAHAVVRQDGLLGGKYLEIVPGDPLLPIISPESILTKASKEQVSVDEILRQFKTVASNVEAISQSFRESLGGEDGQQRIKNMVETITFAIQRIASFSESVDRIVTLNEDRVSGIISDMHISMQEIKSAIPSLKENIEYATTVFGRDFEKISQYIGATSDSVSSTLSEIKASFDQTTSVMQKINRGEGLLGKLITDEEMSEDVHTTVKGFKNYLNKIDTLALVIDGHFEGMQHPNKGFDQPDGKGVINMRIYPTEDYFYVLGFTGSINGYPRRTKTFRDWFNDEDRPLPYIGSIPGVSETPNTAWQPYYFAPREDTIRLFMDSWRVNLQFGKLYSDIGLRVGLFEGTAGGALDLNIPTNSDILRWIMSFEAYDYRGRNRIWTDDRRAHLKWFNKMYMTRNVYFSFGADDFISKYNKNAFFGMGLQFSDDNLKYFLAKLG